MKARRESLLAALAAAVVVATAAAAQKDDWRNKPYRQWTKADVQKVLGDSPWAQTVAQSGTMISVGGTVTATPDKAYTVRLRSALPVRHALLRLRQLDEKYEALSDKKKAEFDEKNRPLVECPACADNYVVSLLPPPTADASRVTLERMKLFVRLAGDGGRARELVHFTPTKAAGQEIVFFFPRLDEKGEPLLTPAGRKLVFSIDTAVFSRLDAKLRRFEFDVSKMIAGGKVEF